MTSSTTRCPEPVRAAASAINILCSFRITRRHDKTRDGEPAEPGLSRRVNLHAIDATLNVDPAPTQDVPKRCHACSKGVGIALRIGSQKQFWTKVLDSQRDSVSAVAAGARLGWVVRDQNRRDRAATCRARVLLYLPS